jgi:hypothetical protein
MQRAIMRAQVRKLKAKARVVSTPEQWYEIVHGPMTGVVVSDKGRALVAGVPTDADMVTERDGSVPEGMACDPVNVASAACYAWNGPPQPNAFGHVAFRNGDPKDRSFKNVYWATVTGKPQVYDTEIRHVSGDFLDNRIDNLFRNEDPRLPAACWAIRHNGPSDA